MWEVKEGLNEVCALQTDAVWAVTVPCKRAGLDDGRRSAHSVMGGCHWVGGWVVGYGGQVGGDP